MPGGPYTWTQAQIPELVQLYTRSESALGPSELRIRFKVSSNEDSLPSPQLIRASDVEALAIPELETVRVLM